MAGCWVAVRRWRFLAGVCGLGLVFGVTPSLAGQQITGSPQARRVARRTIAEVKTKRQLALVYRGAEFDCPGRRGHPKIVTAPHAPPGCHLTTVTIRRNLRRGRIMTQWTSWTAPGFQRVRSWITNSGAWRSYGQRGCWRRVGSGGAGQPAILYKGVRVSLGGRHHGFIFMKESGRGFTEWDTVNAKTYEIVRLRVRAALPGGGEAHLRGTISERDRPFHFSGLHPRCG
jgi:hypothetical protein